MAGELRHNTVGTSLTQAEFEDVALHIFNSQATGDIMYASSATQLTRLGIGATNTVLVVSGGIPSWSATLAGLTLTAPAINGTVTTTGLTMPAFTLGADMSLASTANIVYTVDNRGFYAPNADSNFTIGFARDNGVGWVEVWRMTGAADPYFSMGGSQQFKFYNSGVATFSGKTEGTLSSSDTSALPLDGAVAFQLSNTDNTNNNWVGIAFTQATGVWSNVCASAIFAQFTDHTAGDRDSELVFFTTISSVLAEKARLTNAGHFLPNTAGSQNLGDASDYWGDVSYKTLTDRGCLGSFDAGVEMQDGSIVSDTEALKRIKVKHGELTVYGIPRLDYSTMPKAVYKPAPIATEDIIDHEYDKDGKVTSEIIRHKAGEKSGADGAETTALISIMLGAIKELDTRLIKVENN